MDRKALSHACLRRDFQGHRIEQKHGDIPIRVFRRIYGPRFATAFPASHGLRHTLAMLDRSSLDQLLADEKSGVLDAKIEKALQQEAASEMNPPAG
jgi:hypothetical protein